MKNEKNMEFLIDEATADCFGPYEEMWGFQATINNEMLFPFKANINKKQVEIIGVDIKDDKLVALYQQGNRKYAVNILKLVYDPRQIDGSKWIDAYQQWFTDNEWFFRRRR